MKDFYQDRRILITGAAGTVGREMVRQLHALGPAELRLMDNNESEIFFLMEEYKSNNVHCFLGDVRDSEKIKKLADGIDIIIHSAAFKHVILSEYNPFDVVQTNIIGVENIIRAATSCGVKYVLFTSSDKAVNPTNVMGTSKLMGERLITAANAIKDNGKTIFSSTRFGNVIGSRGSVVPLFIKQIKNGGPVTITDKRMTRFIMTIEEAARLVLKSVVISKGGEVFVIEVNPRASRTIPFVSKTIGVPLARLATSIMVGRTLEELGFTGETHPPYTTVKEAVFPFIKFPGVDTLLGPEMKSTGEVMGMGRDFGSAFVKAQFAAGNNIVLEGVVFISVKDDDKEAVLPFAKALLGFGFDIIATTGTAEFLRKNSVQTGHVWKVAEGRPNIVDRIKSGDVDMVINTTFGAESVRDSYSLRRTTLDFAIPYFTTIAAARAAVLAIKSLVNSKLEVKSLQEYHEQIRDSFEKDTSGQRMSGKALD